MEEEGGPIFVLGAMGSGSTLLRLMLDSHEHIAIPQETGFLRLALAHTWIPFWPHGGEWYGRLGLSDEQLLAEMRGFFGGLFERYARSRGKPRWGEKTPFHVWYADLARRLFPDAVFVGLVRHPGAVTVSLHERFDFSWPDAVGHWLGSTAELLHVGCDVGEQFTLLRYEDLVRAPEDTMRELLDRLGEPWSPSVLAHHEVQPQAGGPIEVEGLTRVDEPLDARRSVRWTASLDDKVRALLRTRTSPIAEFLGYDVDDPSRLDALSPVPGRHVISGVELAQRRADNRTLDWSYRPAPPPDNLPMKPANASGSGGHAAGAVDEPVLRGLTRRLPAPLRTRWYRLRRDHPWLDPRRR